MCPVCWASSRSMWVSTHSGVAVAALRRVVPVAPGLRIPVAATAAQRGTSVRSRATIARASATVPVARNSVDRSRGMSSPAISEPPQ